MIAPRIIVRRIGPPANAVLFAETPGVPHGGGDDRRDRADRLLQGCALRIAVELGGLIAIHVALALWRAVAA